MKFVVNSFEEEGRAVHVQGFETVPCRKGKKLKFNGAEFIVKDAFSQDYARA